MKVLVDTNVIVDALIGRQPYFDNADKIIRLCADKKVHGYLAAHSIPNLFYILRKYLSEEDRRTALRQLCEIFAIEGIQKRSLRQLKTAILQILKTASRMNALFLPKQITS